MGYVKDYMLDTIYKLAKETGYDPDFLIDIWNECQGNGDTWNYFIDVTIERDW